jgi:hypothetical protein
VQSLEITVANRDCKCGRTPSDIFNACRAAQLIASSMALPLAARSCGAIRLKHRLLESGPSLLLTYPLGLPKLPNSSWYCWKSGGRMYFALRACYNKPGLPEQLFDTNRRQEDGAGWHTDEMEVFSRLSHQQDARRRTEVDDSVGAHAVAWVGFVQNDVQCRVANTIDQSCRENAEYSD